MKYLTIVLCCISLFSCNKKIVQLPEIENAPVTEVLDVSPVYMFFDEETDSIEFNRKNMISTTNWLVNIDKRLTLEQILPHLQYLQEKRHSDGMHKNENARNYFTCHDTSINNLGFIEFTDVNFIIDETPYSFYKKISKIYEDRVFIQPIITIQESFHGENLVVEITEGSGTELSIHKILSSEFPEYLKSYKAKSSEEYLVVTLSFNKNLTFQDYISIKSELKKIKSNKISIDNNEFIYEP